MINQLKPAATEEVNAGIVIIGNLFYSKLSFDQHGSSDQTREVMGIFDHGVYQLLSKLLIFIDLKRIAIKDLKKFFKIVLGDHIPMRVVHLIKELKELLQSFRA